MGEGKEESGLTGCLDLDAGLVLGHGVVQLEEELAILERDLPELDSIQLENGLLKRYHDHDPRKSHHQRKQHD